MLRTAALLWLGALAVTTSLFVLVVSAQQVARWVRDGRRAAAVAPTAASVTAVVSVPAQRTHPSVREPASV